MLQKRMDRDDLLERTSELAAIETMRSSHDSGQMNNSEPRKDDEKLSIFWRVFGGTILSIVALSAVTLYNSLSNSISELRSELNKEKEIRAEYVKKDEFNTRSTSQYERIRAAEGMQNSLTALKGEHEGMKEKITNATVALDAMKKDAAGLEVLKEKLNSVSLDVKAMREDFQKVQQEVGQNRSSDIERKTLRDVQMKQHDESMKEMTKGLQECREKIARLEGQQPMGKPAPKSINRPMTDGP